jgi:hypothetical protein
MLHSQGLAACTPRASYELLELVVAGEGSVDPREPNNTLGARLRVRVDQSRG